jgi:hypothetical protein
MTALLLDGLTFAIRNGGLDLAFNVAAHHRLQTALIRIN